MEYNTSALCDIYLDQVDVVEPMFSNFGGRASFAGQSPPSSVLKIIH